MKHKTGYMLPQEVEVWYIIPKLRRELARIFVEKYSLTYDKTGDILGVSKAAISQYFSKKRGDQSLELSGKILSEIENSAKLIFEKKSNGVLEIQKLLNLMKKSHDSCDVCKKYNPDVLKHCKSNPNYHFK